MPRPEASRRIAGARPVTERYHRRVWGGADVADGGRTKLCAYLSAILLGGLVVKATMGWWWADPVAALGIALALNEGPEAWRGETCCD